MPEWMFFPVRLSGKVSQHVVKGIYERIDDHASYRIPFVLPRHAANRPHHYTPMGQNENCCVGASY